MKFTKFVCRGAVAAMLTLSLSVTTLAATTGTVNVGGSVLRVRKAASTSAAVIDMLPHGKTVTITGDAVNGWYPIRLSSGATGYVSADYIKVSGSSTASTGTSSTASTAAESKATQETSQPAEATQANTTAVTENSTDAAQSEEATATYVKVTVSALNVRSGPATSYSKIGSYSKGRIVKVLGETNGWYQLEKGYICAEYTEKVDYEAVAASGKGAEMANLALTFVGYPYVYGGASPSAGFDCSGLVQYVCKQFGYSINRTASTQLNNGVAVAWDDLQPGDLVFFKKSGTGSSPVSHVGMYIGDGKFVHASDYGVGVIISRLTDAYYTTGFVAARRIAY